MSEEGGAKIQITDDNGVYKNIIKEGNDKNIIPSKGCTIIVHYTGTLLDGTKFDSSKDRNQPFEFELGQGKVIKAWDLGIATMCKGEICVLTCAPEYAYGEHGSPPKIPPGATLQFEVELIDFKGEDLTSKKNNGILRYIIESGTGFDTPNDCACVDVDLEGRLVGKEDAPPFDVRSVSFNIGEGFEQNICEGIEKALEKFQKGEKSRLVLQPKYAFKAEGNKELGVPPDAVVEYTVTLKSFELAKESWSMESAEKIEQAKICKDKGTEFFKTGKYSRAIKMYKKSTSFLSHDGGFAEEFLTERTNLLLSLHLNLSLCYLKCNPAMPLQAKDSAKEALTFDKKNVKALFRWGQALQLIGDQEQAISIFKQLLEVEPDNKAAANQITLCQNTIQEHKVKEKKIYANMFEKFAQKDRETEQLIAKGMPDVMGETLGEWGSGPGEWEDKDRDNRAPTEFEKENPNILMLVNDGQFANM